MQKQYFAVYDKTAAIYMAPFLEINKGTAIRAIQNVVSTDKESQLAKYPHDYQLVHLGWFDDQTGEIGVTKMHKIADINELTSE